MLLAGAGLTLALVPATTSAAGPPVGFAPPVYVDNNLAGGEPVLAADPVHGTLVYSSHEGTTHLYRNGIVNPIDFGANYRNQVNIWTSKDNGATWQRDDLATFQGAEPTKSNGFSDPDLTLDEGARVYNTGINLANDSLFSSMDGGRTFDKGTAQCHNGDRPWLAGGRKDEVFLATDTVEGASGGHTIFRSSDGGNTCESSGVPDAGDFPGGGTYTGFGKLYYDHARRLLVEPILISHSKQDGVGVATAAPGQPFTPVKAADVPTGIFAHWPAIALDSAGTIYAVWDTNDRATGGTGGCNANLPPPGPADEPAPLPNSIQMAISTDHGKTFQAPVTIARPAGRRVFWPWIAAGSAGKVSVVWYETDKVTDPDCQSSTVSVRAAQIFDADKSGAAQTTIVDPIGRPIHPDGTVCQGGTTCVATGQDRRLGDFFTNAIDANGCVIIGTGDTSRMDPVSGQPRPTSLPLFVRQNSGPSLTGGQCGPPASSPLVLGPGGVTSGCTDRVRPLSRITRRLVRGTRRALSFRGTASDRGCANAAAHFIVPGKVARVRIAVARVVSRLRCRFLLANHRLGAIRDCRRRIYHAARGTTRWSYGVRGSFPRGIYRVRVNAVDARGNVERYLAPSYQTFRVR